MFFRNIFLTLLFTVMSLNAFGRAGDLDPTFNQNGTNRVGFRDGMGVGQALARQADGKYLIAGRCTNGTETGLCVRRYDTGGSLDETFGENGTVNVHMYSGGWGQDATSIVVRPDGRLVVGGTNRNGNRQFEIALIGLNPDGSLDQTFGSGGRGMFPSPRGYRIIADIALQDDGKIVAVGWTEEGQRFRVLVARFNENGTADNGFGTGGIVLTRYGAATADSRANSVAIQPDGKIVVAGGDGQVYTSTLFAVFRFLTDGTPDPGFGTAGKAGVPFIAAQAEAQSVALQADGKLVIAGFRSNDNKQEIALARLDQHGMLDPAFDFDGRLTPAPITGRRTVNSVVVDAAGRIVVAGTDSTANPSKAIVMRYLTDGQPDGSFNHGGMPTVSRHGWTTGEAVLAEPGGNIAVAGLQSGTISGSPSSFAVLRFTPNGGEDHSFGIGGIAVDPIGKDEGYVTDVKVQPDGKAVVVGFAGGWGRGVRASISRFDTDGRLDQTFGDGGKVVLDPTDGDSTFYGVSIRGDGRIVAAGQAGAYPSAGILLVRFNHDGSLDPSFDGDGIAVSYVATGAQSMVTQPDGKIVVHGVDLGRTHSVARFDENGQIDTSFDSDGLQTFSYSSTYNTAMGIAIGPDGKIIVCGSAEMPTSFDSTLARLNMDGSFDLSFGTNGKVITDLDNGDDGAYSVVVQPDGKIITGGASGHGAFLHTTVTRYNVDGSLDPTFGVAGRAITPLAYSDYAWGVALQADGKLVVTGEANHIWSQQLVVSRFNTDGTLDSDGFATMGSVTIPFTSLRASGRAIAVDGNGRIVVAGQVGGIFGVARLQGDDPLAPFRTKRRVSKD